MDMDGGDDRGHENDYGHVHDHANARASDHGNDREVASKAAHAQGKTPPHGKRHHSLHYTDSFLSRRQCLQHDGGGFLAPDQPDLQNPKPARDTCTSGNSSRLCLH